MRSPTIQSLHKRLRKIEDGHAILQNEFFRSQLLQTALANTWEEWLALRQAEIQRQLRSIKLKRNRSPRRTR